MATASASASSFIKAPSLALRTGARALCINATRSLIPMASLTLPHSVASSFFGHFHILSSPSPVRSPHRNPRTGHGTVVPVRATADIVLVDKSEAEKTYRLKATYLEKIVPRLKEEFKYTNVHQVPKLEKIVVNCGMGDAGQNSKGLEAALKDIALITGQRPVRRKR